MEAATLDILLMRGGDWDETINLYEDDGETVKDSSGYSMEMTISNHEETYDTLVIGGGITHTPIMGQFNLRIPYDTINAYKFLTAERRVVLISPDGTRSVIVIGTVTLR